MLCLTCIFQTPSTDRAPARQSRGHMRSPRRFTPAGHVTADLRDKRPGFTLIELLVVISLTGLLIAIMLPGLRQARELARQLVCLNHMNSLQLGLTGYALEQNSYPPAYRNQVMSGAGTALRIMHWSGILLQQGYAEGGFGCPSFPRQGLPPAGTAKDNLEPGQSNPNPLIADSQALRCAFTVNEALFPRDRFAVQSGGLPRLSRLVKPEQIRHAAGTILATEWTRDWKMLEMNGICRSFLPLHGFSGLGPMGPDRYDLNQVDTNNRRPCFRNGAFRRLQPEALSDHPNPGRVNPPRLDWVGRNHGGKAATSNFVYADGHAQNKTIYATLMPFEWGREIYSIEGGSQVVP